jgi:lysine 2,3-aminomutase
MEQQDDLSNDGQTQLKTEQAETADPPLPSSDKTKSFKSKYYPEATQKQWDDWKWQVRNSITSYKELQRIFGSSDELSEDINLPLRITPYYASTITSLDAGIGKCVIPTNNELIVTPNEENDSLHEEHQSPVECIVHRYPDRVLFLTTDFCSSNCRYCTRSRLINRENISRKTWDKGIQYIKDHPEIRDVLISGGDPLTMNDDSIEYLLKEIRAIEHVEFLRIGTKVPVVLPQRITPELVNMLKKYHPLFISIHFSHPDEITPEVKEACERLANVGIPLGSQTVLLKGVNDETDVMKKLMHSLLKIRVRPYYIYACDHVVGTSHFRTTINKGLQIIQSLRGFTSGYAVPQFIVDTPGGKIPLLPDYFVGRDGNCVILRNYEGQEIKYYED